MKRLLTSGLVILVMTLLGFWSCEKEIPDNVIGTSDISPVEFKLNIERVITILANPEANESEIAFLESLTSDDWVEVNTEIERQGIRFLPEGGIEYIEESEHEPNSIAGCPWNGTTRWNVSVTQSQGYRFQGHYAVYFTVDANADCYSKNADWWVLTWVPGHGDVHNWDLLLYRDRYWNGSRWVKDVLLLIPTTWWCVYYPHWPAWYKAERFYLRWIHYNNGCCE